MSIEEEREYFLQQITTQEGQKKLVEILDQTVPTLKELPIPQKHKEFDRLMDLLEIAYFNAKDRRFLNQVALRITTFAKEMSNDDLLTKSYLIRLLQYLPSSAEVIAIEEANIFKEGLNLNIPWYEGIVARVAYFVGQEMPDPAQEIVYNVAIEVFSEDYPPWRKEPLALLLASLFNKKRKENAEMISKAIAELLEEPGKRGRNALWASILLLRKKEAVGKYLDLFMEKALERITIEKSSEFAGMMLTELETLPDETLKEWEKPIVKLLRVARYSLSVNKELIKQIGEKIGVLIE